VTSRLKPRRACRSSASRWSPLADARNPLRPGALDDRVEDWCPCGVRREDRTHRPVFGVEGGRVPGEQVEGAHPVRLDEQPECQHAGHAGLLRGAAGEVRPASVICEVVGLEDVVLSDGVEARPLAHLVLDGGDLCGDVVAAAGVRILPPSTSVPPVWSQPSMVVGASSTILSSVACTENSARSVRATSANVSARSCTGGPRVVTRHHVRKSPMTSTARHHLAERTKESIEAMTAGWSRSLNPERRENSALGR